MTNKDKLNELMSLLLDEEFGDLTVIRLSQYGDDILQQLLLLDEIQKAISSINIDPYTTKIDFTVSVSPGDTSYAAIRKWLIDGKRNCE